MILRRDKSDTSGAHRPVLIGLTGPIGCGKSTVGRMLAEVGGEVIDADALAREVTARGSDALPDIRQRFGDAIFVSDELDRAALAEIVFADAEALRALEDIVHPRVRRLVESRLESATEDGVPFVVIEAIKLVEGGLAERCDEVWIIECSEEVQSSRLAGRGASPNDVALRVGAQGTDLAGRLADALAGRPGVRRLSTDGTLGETREAVEDALAEALDRQLG